MAITIAQRAGAVDSIKLRGKGSGRRGTEALKLVREKPGIGILEIAAEMGINRTCLYRVLARRAD